MWQTIFNLYTKNCTVMVLKVIMVVLMDCYKFILVYIKVLFRWMSDYLSAKRFRRKKLFKSIWLIIEKYFWILEFKFQMFLRNSVHGISLKNCWVWMRSCSLKKLAIVSLRFSRYVMDMHRVFRRYSCGYTFQIACLCRCFSIMFQLYTHYSRLLV